MAHDVNIWGVRIRLKTSTEDFPELGIFSVAGSASELRVSEAPLAGVGVQYATGFLRRDWRPEIRIRPETTKLGGIAVRDSITIPLQNANQFSLRCDELGVVLSGCRLEIFEFVGDEVDSYQTVTLLFRGVIEDIEGWDEQEIRIVANPPSRQRETKLSIPIGVNNFPAANKNNGKIIPLTYGKLDKGRYLRTDDLKRVFVPQTGLVVNASPQITMLVTGEAAQHKVFQVAARTPADPGIYTGIPPLTYLIRFANFGAADTVEWRKAGATFVEELDVSYFVGKYIEVVSGEKSLGEIRKIASAKVYESGEPSIGISLESPFSEALVAQEAWVQIFDTSMIYTGDFWPLAALNDFDGNPTTTNHEIFVYDSSAEQYRVVCGSTVSATASADHTAITVNPAATRSNLEKLTAATIIPVLNPKLDPSQNIDGFNRVTDGLFDNGGTVSSLATENEIENVVDRNQATSYDAVITIPAGSAGNKVMYALEFRRPALTNNFKFNKCYIGLNMSAHFLVAAKLRIGWRRFIGSPIFVYDKNWGGPGPSATHRYAVNLPSSYYDPAHGDDEDFYFLRENGRIATDQYKSSGYTLFELTGITDHITYEQIHRLTVQVIITRTANAMAPWVSVREVALIFTHQEYSIETELFASPSGRIRNAAWRAGKAATDLLRSPQDLVEHVARLQNFSNIPNPGREYDPNPLINTVSFDDAYMNAVDGEDFRLWKQGDLMFARQIDEENEASSSAMIRSLCEDSHLVSYQGPDGYERIEPLQRLGTPVDTITLSKKFELGRIIPPRLQDVYCCPTVRYNYDPGSKKYLGHYSRYKKRHLGNLRVLSASSPVYDPSYVEGFDNDTDAKIIYDLCHQLFKKYRHVEPMPASLSERKWIVNYTDALWWLYHFLLLQDRPRAYLVVPYEVGRLWTYGTVINIQFPHQTNNQVVRAKIEGVALRKPRMRVDLVLVDPVTTHFYDIVRRLPLQITGSVAAPDRNWQTTKNGYADRGETGQPDRQTTGEI